MRPSREEVYFEVAESFSKRSTCLRGSIGAIIVKDKHIVSHGYNGAPAGMPQCDEVGCDIPERPYLDPPWNSPDDGPSIVLPLEHQLGCQRTVHAEANAIAWAARWGVLVGGATMYSTHEPCRKCADLIVACGIKAVYFRQPYRLGASTFLIESGVKVYDSPGSI